MIRNLIRVFDRLLFEIRGWFGWEEFAPASTSPQPPRPKTDEDLFYEWLARPEPSRKEVMESAAAAVHAVKAEFLGGMDVAIEAFLQRMERAAAGSWSRGELPPALFATVDDETLTDYAGLAEMIDEAMAPVVAELAVAR